MSKELKISNVLDKHLSPIQIDGASVPIELSKDAVRFNENVTFQKDLIVEGDLSVLGATTEINMTEGVLLESQSTAGYLSFTALGFSLLANGYSGNDGDATDNNALLTLHSSDGYDSAISLYNTTSLIWTIGRDGDDSNKLKYDYNALTGAATKLALDSSGNSTQEGSISIKEKASAIADTAAYGQIWVKTATPNELYFTTDAGDDIQLTSGTSAAGGGGGTARWTTTAGGYKTNNNSALTYYFQYYPNYHLWSNSDSSPTTISYQDSYAYQFCAPADGTLTNIRVTCRA